MPTNSSDSETKPEETTPEVVEARNDEKPKASKKRRARKRAAAQPSASMGRLMAVAKAEKAEAPPVAEAPTMLAKNAFRGSSSPIVTAFLTTEKIRHGRRRLTRAQWRSEYEAFVNRER